MFLLGYFSDFCSDCLNEQNMNIQKTTIRMDKTRTAFFELSRKLASKCDPSQFYFLVCKRFSYFQKYNPEVPTFALIWSTNISSKNFSDVFIIFIWLIFELYNFELNYLNYIYLISWVSFLKSFQDRKLVNSK